MIGVSLFLARGEHIDILICEIRADDCTVSVGFYIVTSQNLPFENLHDRGKCIRLLLHKAKQSHELELRDRNSNSYNRFLHKDAV